MKRLGSRMLLTIVAATVVAAIADDAASAAGTGGWKPPACHRRVTQPVVAVRVPGVASDWTITSFDGTQIRAHWFPLAGVTRGHPAPTVMMGPGWSLPGDTDVSGNAGVLGGASIAALRRGGYNVLTWDPRAFGNSTGRAEVDSAAYEGRDVSRLIDWLSGLPGVKLDRPGDPRIGMIGASYGGGIQWIAAATDCRIDAIVPNASWHSLVTSLDKAGTYKAGWGNLLASLVAHDRVDPHILQGSAQANATGRISSDIRRWFAGRGPASLLSRIRIPTLIEQGTVDTLFTLQEGIDNYQVLRANHVPVAMLWYCGGHGTCFTAPGAQNLPGIAAIAWMNRWVKREPQVTTGPAVTVIDQRGIRYAASGYPVPSGSPLTATGHGRLVLTASGGAGPVLAEPPGATDPLGGLALPFTPAEARNAVNVRVQARQRAALVVGAPLVTLRYRGTAAAGVRPTRVFAQLVDDSTHLVLGNQITPIDLTLDGKTHTTQARMEVVTQWMAARHSTTLQLVATTVAYAAPRLGGSVSFERITIALPTTRPGALAKIGPGRAK